MVAPQTNPVAEGISGGREIPIRSRSHFQRLAKNLSRAAKLQAQIMSLKAKKLVKRVVFSALLGMGATLAGLVGLIFTYIFVFKLLTDVAHIPAVWVWLIFAGFHLGMAGVMVLVVANMWRDPAKKEARS